MHSVLRFKVGRPGFERCPMTRVFSARRVETSERRHDPQTRQMTEWRSAGGYFQIEQEAEDFIEDTLGQRFGVIPNALNTDLRP